MLKGCTLTRHFYLCSLSCSNSRPLTPYRRRITIWRQSGGSPCAFPGCVVMGQAVAPARSAVSWCGFHGCDGPSAAYVERLSPSNRGRLIVQRARNHPWPRGDFPLLVAPWRQGRGCLR